MHLQIIHLPSLCFFFDHLIISYLFKENQTPSPRFGEVARPPRARHIDPHRFGRWDSSPGPTSPGDFDAKAKAGASDCKTLQNYFQKLDHFGYLQISKIYSTFKYPLSEENQWQQNLLQESFRIIFGRRLPGFFSQWRSMAAVLLPILRSVDRRNSIDHPTWSLAIIPVLQLNY